MSQKPLDEKTGGTPDVFRQAFIFYQPPPGLTVNPDDDSDTCNLIRAALGERNIPHPWLMCYPSGRITAEGAHLVIVHITHYHAPHQMAQLGRLSSLGDKLLVLTSPDHPDREYIRDFCQQNGNHLFLALPDMVDHVERFLRDAVCCFTYTFNPARNGQLSNPAGLFIPRSEVAEGIFGILPFGANVPYISIVPHEIRSTTPAITPAVRWLDIVVVARNDTEAHRLAEIAVSQFDRYFER